MGFAGFFAPLHPRAARRHVRLLGGAIWDVPLLQRVFKAFQYRDFRLMWIGACTSTIGTWMQTVAQSWLVYELSKNNAFFLGLDGFLGQIPIMLLSLVGGVIADR